MIDVNGSFHNIWQYWISQWSFHKLGKFAWHMMAIYSSYWKPTGKRPVGHSKQRWMDNIEKDLKIAGLSLYGITKGRNRVRLEELVGDRDRWKDITTASMAGRAFRMTTWPDLKWSNASKQTAAIFVPSPYSLTYTTLACITFSYRRLVT